MDRLRFTPEHAIKVRTLGKRSQLNYHERRNPQLKKSARESETA